MSESDLGALSRRDLQQLCKREDVCRWRRIKANTKVGQTDRQTASWMCCYNCPQPRRVLCRGVARLLSTAVLTACCVRLCLSVCQSSAMISQLLHFFDSVHSVAADASSAAVETGDSAEQQQRRSDLAGASTVVGVTGGDSVAGSVSVVLSSQQLDESDGEIYFNVSVMRDSEEQPTQPQQPQPPPAAQQPQQQQQQRSEAVPLTGTIQHALAAATASGAPAAVSFPATISAVRKRKAGEQCSVPSRATDAARVALLAESDHVKRVRTSVSTKVTRAAHQRDSNRTLSASSKKGHPIATTRKTAPGRPTHQRQPSNAPLSSGNGSSAPLPLLVPASASSPSALSTAQPPSASSSSASSSSSSSSSAVCPSVQPSSTYAAMLAELDARVAAAATDGPREQTATARTTTAHTATTTTTTTTTTTSQAASSRSTKRAANTATSERKLQLLRHLPPERRSCTHALSLTHSLLCRLCCSVLFVLLSFTERYDRVHKRQQDKAKSIVHHYGQQHTHTHTQHNITQHTPAWHVRRHPFALNPSSA